MTSVFEVNGKRFFPGKPAWVMGVINVTPDSFYDGGRYFGKKKAVHRAMEMVDQGVEILDLGGESSRPGSEPISAEEELCRVLPVLKAIRPRTSCLISIDTTKASVARAALEEGADIINDISAFRADPKMIELAAASRAGLILMHMKGTPKTMQVAPFYEDVVAEVYSFLEERIDWAVKNGVAAERIIIDPGVGFGKRLEDNLRLINELSVFSSLGRPVLIGVSRKSFIGQVLNLPPEERLEGTIAAVVISLVRGASIFRVHDPLEVGRALRVAEAILSARDLMQESTKQVDHVQ